MCEKKEEEWGHLIALSCDAGRGPQERRDWRGVGPCGPYGTVFTLFPRRPRGGPRSLVVRSRDKRWG
ncbi:hypothetical protein ACOSQ4_001124 [Xanthoceras sorbifolium]